VRQTAALFNFSFAQVNILLAPINIVQDSNRAISVGSRHPSMLEFSFAPNGLPGESPRFLHGAISSPFVVNPEEANPVELSGNRLR
jgi:hypothetical protein